MSFPRDIFSPAPRTNVPLTVVTTPQEHNYVHHDGSTEPGPSSTHPLARPIPRRTHSLPDAPVPPYDEDEEDDFNACAVPRRSADRSRLYPPSAGEATHSVCSSATNTPAPSRSSSPFPFYYSGASSCSSDSESEPESPLLSRSRRPTLPWRNGERPRWWRLRLGSGSSSAGSNDPWRRRRRWRDVSWGLRSCKRLLRRLVRHPFFPKTPVTILLTLLFLTIFGVSLTFLLIYILNPDKEPLPWRGYCTLPQHSGGPPSVSLSPTALLQTPLPTNITYPSFPPPDFDTLAPAGVFIGVFSMDTSVERRMLVRSTWARHMRSREGAATGDDGVATSRTIVRFILGQPSKDWERRVKLEMETYKDMVILPITESMNRGKTHAFFSWAANHSWVPPLYYDDFTQVPTNFTYLNASIPAPSLASHDPLPAHRDQMLNSPAKPWVRPDFVVKADDDSFVMLAELEARLRVELHKEPLPPPPPPQSKIAQPQVQPRGDNDEARVLDYNQIASYFDFSLPSYMTRTPPTLAAVPTVPEEPPLSPDPLVFWGYLVKNRFMAGELYALSFALVDWVANDPVVKTMTRGAEDKQTSKWIRAHPRAEQVRWTSERCWIYDHPRAGTVYSHGFLFPSEVKRVQEGAVRDIQRLAQQAAKTDLSTSTYATPPGQWVAPPEKWRHSTVSKFGVHYSPPVGDLNLDHSVEALVEGSDMSMVHEDGSMTPDLAWKYREGRRRRYEGKRLGGTVVVHFIKKNMWFLETAAALLHGDDVTPLEQALEQVHGNMFPKDGNADTVAHSELEPESSAGSGPSADADADADVGVDVDSDSISTLARTHTKSRTMVRRSRRRLG
ncbi:hypothetical protein L227DRAFT_572759 [Lentinus tigrinus ALCF2SS1-6]|uniref:Glycosyltransferase family 31 protein n=1 Tax=Lentinus tigrinus ALCF2SS1-6 TaxID=1328759 RepID=A0A5C2SGW0_9APHY|nr:hypothetical protein L227DRAFT_572759 [Lentinus tigrinus ALCF2SS1-6]